MFIYLFCQCKQETEGLKRIKKLAAALSYVLKTTLKLLSRSEKMGAVPLSDTPGEFVDSSVGDSEKTGPPCRTEVEGARAGVVVAGWDTDAGSWVGAVFPEVEVDGGGVEDAVHEAGVRGFSGPAAVPGGGGPAEEASGGSVDVDVCSSDVRVGEDVELWRAGVGLSESSSKSTRWEE